MTAGLWGIVAALVIVAALLVVGAIGVARQLLPLVRRAQAIAPPAIDVERAQRSFEKLQRDVATFEDLATRARVAMHTIDVNVRAIIRALSRA